MKCFVISPIGQPGSETRRHADSVYECIVRPALEKAGIDGRRADHIKDVGRITKQMYDDILSSDFCIAVLHGSNPNVFYELAIAHSAGIPVLLLSEVGTVPPFDLKDERLFHYDLDPIAIFRGDNIQALLTMIDSVRRLEGKREVPFGSNLRPLNAVAADLPFGLRNETNATAEYWLRLVGSAHKRFHMAGIGFTGWRGIPGMREALGASANGGCEIRVLTMDAKNPAFGAMMNPDVTAGDPVTQGPGIADARAWFRSALAGAPKAEVRALRGGMLYQQIIICDDKALVSPYLYFASTGYSPCLEVRQSSPVVGAYLREFDSLWGSNPASS